MTLQPDLDLVAGIALRFDVEVPTASDSKPDRLVAA
jgi:hypothetical protein